MEQNLNVRQTNIPDVLVIEPRIFQDDRGFFLETYQYKKYEELGIPNRFVQDNHSGSRKGVLRGLHYQIRQTQGKLISVIAGEIFDVAVDLRTSSSTFGNSVCVVLSAKSKSQIWVPPGFAHGFLVLSEWAEIVYKATDYYAPEWERTLLWNDPALAIDWPIIDGKKPILSLKDEQGLPIHLAEKFD